MNPTRKKFVSMFLVFSLMTLSVNLYAKERRGAKLLITKKDRWQIEGELITVKPNSILILDTEGKDVSVGIAEIKVIRIVKKSKDLLGAGIGLLIGVGPGALIGYKVGWKTSEGALWGGVVGGLAGALIGCFTGIYLGKEATIQIGGMSDSEIQEALDKLRKKARIPYYK
jgi:hypothetical protein